jgi:hypothetical protein
MSPVTEQDLARELRRQAEQVGGAPLQQLEQVKAGASRIRQQRRLTAGLAAVAALVAAAPASQVAVTAFDGTAEQQVAGPSPSASASALAAPSRPVTLTTTGLPIGDAPKVAYFDVGELVTADGRRLPLPATLQRVVPYADGYLGTGYAGEGAQVFHLDEELNVLSRIDSGEALAVTPDGTHLSWVQLEDDGSQMLVDAPATGHDPLAWSFPERPVITPVGFVDEDTVVYGTDGVRPSAGLATVGGQTRKLEGFLKVTAASPATGLVAGQTSYTMEGGADDGSCWKVVAPAQNDATVWDTCDYSLISFSPDGRLLLASDPYQSGLGSGSLTILDAQSGKPLATFRQQPGSQVALTTFAWEDSDTVLAVALDEGEGTWSVLRAGLDGALETAVEPVPTSRYGDMPFRFAAPR